jgi:hypothetical protein
MISFGVTRLLKGEIRPIGEILMVDLGFAPALKQNPSAALESLISLTNFSAFMEARSAKARMALEMASEALTSAMMSKASTVRSSIRIRKIDESRNTML